MDNIHNNSIYTINRKKVNSQLEQTNNGNNIIICVDGSHSHLADLGEPVMWNVLSVQSIEINTREADNATDQHYVVDERLRHLNGPGNKRRQQLSGNNDNNNNNNNNDNKNDDDDDDKNVSEVLANRRVSLRRKQTAILRPSVTPEWCSRQWHKR